jgi:hypothetical protein
MGTGTRPCPGSTGDVRTQEAIMKRLSLALAGAAIAILAVAATASAAGPSPSPAGDQLRARDTIPTILGLSQAELMDLRRDGLTLAQIAERQNVVPQKLIDALVAQWTIRIDARVANGALTSDAATALKEQLTLRATAMVNQAPLGGMRGAAVGAGPGNGYGMRAGGAAGSNGASSGTGTCDGTGPHGQGRS